MDGTLRSTSDEKSTPILVDDSPSPVALIPPPHPPILTPSIHRLKAHEVELGPMIKTGVVSQIRKARLHDGPFVLAAKMLKVSALTEKEKEILLADVGIRNRLISLKHENVLAQHGSMLEAGNVHLVEEFAERGSLTELFEHYKDHHWERLKEMTSTQITKIIQGVAQGINVQPT